MRKDYLINDSELRGNYYGWKNEIYSLHYVPKIKL